MKKLKYIFALAITTSFGFSLPAPTSAHKIIHSSKSIDASIHSVWENVAFKNLISYDVFNLAMKGYYKHDSFKSGIIAIVDYSKPSTEKRFYVIDIKNKKLLFHTLIAHGKNTGANMATNFANVPESLKSSLGFFKTAETYHGKHGFSLRLDGLENGINHNARERAIVIHGANYVSNDFIKAQGRLGRSWGCPALPTSLSTDIIKSISNGTCLFIYGNDSEYTKSSKFLK